MPILFDHEGFVIDERAGLPKGDLTLEDGRILVFRGQMPPPLRHAFCWTTVDDLRVLASMDDTQHGELLHVSLSYRDLNPSWEDIKVVRGAFFPDDIDVMMVLPKKEDYVNAHKHTFHLWQTPVAWNIR